MNKKDRKLRNIVSLIVVLIMALMLALVMGIHTAFAMEYDVAYANTQMVEVDGKPIEFNMYALRTDKGDTNYVRLRDVAYVLDGTSSSFNVDYNNNTIYIFTSMNYLGKNSGGMTTPFSGNMPYKAGTTTMMVDYKPITLQTITLTDNNGGGYTYVKLRDLGNAIGFEVDWNAKSGITIETPKIETMDVAEEVIRLINKERIKVGLSPLGTYTALDEVAKIRALELTEKYSHTRPSGGYCDSLMHSNGAIRNVWAIGENIAGGYRTASEVMDAWMNSSGHRDNILSRDYTHVAVAMAYGPNNTCYWVQVFAGVMGRPSNETPASNYVN